MNHSFAESYNIKGGISMNIWEEMEEKKSTFTPKEMKVYEIIKNDPYSFTASTADGIAARYDISQSAISRFCQKLGYTGFSDFRMSMAVAAYNRPPEVQGVESSQDFSYYLSDFVRRIGQIITPDTLEALAKKIIHADTVYVSGYGASDIAASLLALRLTTYRQKAFYMIPSKEIEYLHVIGKNDMVVLFSAYNASHTDFFSLVDDTPEEKLPYMVLVSNTARHPFSNKVNENVVMPTWHSLNYPYEIESNFAQITFVMLLTDKMNRILNENSSNE
jgi:Transcriptional regulators